MVYVWDEAPTPPKLETVQTPSISVEKKYVWEDDEIHSTVIETAPIYPVANYDTVQKRINEMVEELRCKRESVQERRIELRRVRESAAAESRELQIRWEAKIRQNRMIHEEKIQHQKKFAAQLQEDIRQLKRRTKELEAHESRAESAEAAELEALRAEHHGKLMKAKQAWIATENKELANVVDKRRDTIKAKVVKALEPQVQRLVRSHRTEIAHRRENDEEWLNEQKAQMKKRYQVRYVDESAALTKKFEKELDIAQVEVEEYRREERKRAEKEIELLWESEKRALDEERERYERERDRLDKMHRSDIQELAQREAQAFIHLETEHKRKLREDAQTEMIQAERIQREHDFVLQKRRADLDTELAARFDSDLAERLEPIREKIERELEIILEKLDADNERVAESLASTLEKERAELLEAHHDALAKLQTQETDAMQQYMTTTKQQQSLQAELSNLERECETLQEQTAIVEQELRDTGLECEKRQKHADALQIQIQTEHDAQQAQFRQAILDTNRRFNQVLEDINTADQEAHDYEIKLKTDRELQFQQIEAKINAVIQRRLQDRDNQLALLQKAQQHTTDLDAQIAFKREQQLAASVDYGPSSN